MHSTNNNDDYDNTGSGDDGFDFSAGDLDIVNEYQCKLARLNESNIHQTRSNFNYNRTHSNINKSVNIFSDNDNERDYEDEHIQDLLTKPLSAKEREAFTASGIKLVIENGRTKLMNPHCKINIESWNDININNSFNSVLAKFGKTTEDFLLYLKWDGLDRYYIIDWKDITSPYIPWYRDGFHIFLKCTNNSRKRKERDNDTKDSKNKKRRKYDSRNERRRNAYVYLRNGMKQQYVKYVDQRSDYKHIWFRIMHLYLNKDLAWTVEKLNQFVHDEYMVHDIKYQINNTSMEHPTLTQPDINKTTKHIIYTNNNNNNNNNKNNTANTAKIHGIGQDNKYWETVFNHQTEDIFNPPPPEPQLPPQAIPKLQNDESRDDLQRLLAEHNEISMKLAKLQSEFSNSCNNNETQSASISSPNTSSITVKTTTSTENDSKLNTE